MNYSEFIEEWTDGKTFIKVCSSGSTGEPKIIRLGKDFVRASARRTIDFFNLSNKSHLHSCISPDFIGGKMMAVRAKMLDCQFSWETPSNEPKMEEIDSEKEILDLVAVVPSQMNYIIENKDKLPRIRNIIVGGAPISEDLKKRIEASGLTVYETYGMTETASHIALRKIDGKNVYFKTLGDISVRMDERGCLVISIDRQEIVTNDLCEIKNKREFKINGRLDNVIITGARKVNPVDIEKVLEKIIDAPFMITGFPDEKWGEKIVLLINQEKKIDEESFRMRMRALLPSWQIPKEILYVNSFHETGNGKIIRSKRREDFSFVRP